MSVIAAQLASKHMFRGADEVTDTAVTIRQPSSANFGIDSSDRYASYNARASAPTGPYQFLISKNESLLNGFFTRIALTEIVFPYYIPNINNKTDMILVSENGGALQTITIPLTGFYSPAALADVLETQLQTALSNPSLSVAYSNGLFVFKTNTTDTIAFARGNFASPGAKLNEFQLYDLLNLSGPGLNGLQVASTTQISGVTRCRYTEYIDITCSQLTYNQELKDGSSDPVVRDMIARVYIEDETSPVIPVYQTASPVGPIMTSDVAIPGTYPFTIYRKFSMPKQILWNKAQPIGNLQFEVYDDKGQILSANIGPTNPDNTMPDWRMTLLVSEN